MKRLWGVRHIRYWWYRRQVYRFAAFWAERGLGLGYPNPMDVAYLDAVWRGEM